MVADLLPSRETGLAASVQPTGHSGELLIEFCFRAGISSVAEATANSIDFTPEINPRPTA